MQNVTKYIITLMAATIVALFLLLQNSCNKTKELSTIYASASDSLHNTINKLGQEQTTTATLLGTVDDLKKLSSSKDSVIKKLQGIVDKNTSTATVLGTQTSSSSTTATTVIKGGEEVKADPPLIKHDTVFQTDTVFPAYKTVRKSRWDSINVVANKDSIKVGYVVYNEFDLKTEWVSQGLFKPKKCVASVLNNNPNTRTLEFKTFEIQPPKHNRFVDWLIGAGIGAGVVFLLIK